MAENNRRFEGIWIPANVWLSKELTMQEKIFLVEIKSLDNERGCFASNDYFSEHFQLSKSRCSEVISKLKEKELLTIELIYKDNSKQVDKRIIRVNYAHPLFNDGIRQIEGGVRKTEAPIRDSEGGLRDIEDPPSENAKDNSTLINNTDYISNTTNRSREVFNTIQNNIRFNLSPIEIDTVDYWLKDYPHELILEAIRRAVLANKTNLRYIETILMDWQKKRITTVAEVERDDEAFNQRKGGVKHGSDQRQRVPKTMDAEERLRKQVERLQDRL